MDAFDLARRAESDLWAAITAGDGAFIEARLHADFAEVLRSGQLLTRAEIMASAYQGSSADVDLDDWGHQLLAPGIVLVTYVLRSDQGDSRRCSIWDVSGEPPVMRFHQATTVPR